MAEESNMGAAVVPGAVVPCANGQLYTVRSGDSMFAIARQFNIPLATLVAANPQIADPNLIYPGQSICVPGPATPACAGGFTYTVQSGDTLFAIAGRFGLSLTALEAANPQIANPDLIYPGQIICVPVATMPLTCPQGTAYTVRAGDTMFDIATRFGLTLQALLAANPQIADPNRIYVGQVICVPALPMGAVLPAPVAISPAVSPPPMAVPQAPIPTAPMPEIPVAPVPEVPVAPMPEVPAAPPMEQPLPQFPQMPMAPQAPVTSPVTLPAPSVPACPPPLTCPMPMNNFQPPMANFPLPFPAMCPIYVQPERCERRRHGHHHHRRNRCCPRCGR